MKCGYISKDIQSVQNIECIKKQVRGLTKKHFRTNINVLTYKYESTYVIKDYEEAYP